MILKEAELEASPSMMVYRKRIPVLIIEAKKSVGISFTNIEVSDVLELLIYCYYITRIHDLSSIIGTITDGKTWHTMELQKATSAFTIEKYIVLCSQDEGVIVGSIPKLVDLLWPVDIC